MQRWARHSRFLLAFALGLAVLAVTSALGLDLMLRALLAINGFFLSYLVLMLALTVATSPEDLRKHSEQDDEGITLILILALGSVGAALASVILVLSDTAHTDAQAVLALSAVPLGWAMLHMLLAYRYANLYYSADPDTGLEFPGAADTSLETDLETWDFVYFSFTIGMTAQVSDVVVTTAQIRRTVLFHGVGSFFYNTVILALAVNAAIAMSA